MQASAPHIKQDGDVLSELVSDAWTGPTTAQGGSTPAGASVQTAPILRAPSWFRYSDSPTHSGKGCMTTSGAK